MIEILIDTNLLVYMFDLAEEEKRKTAIDTLRELEIHQRGCLSVQCLSEFVNATTRRKVPLLTLAEAAAQVDDFILAFPTFPLTTTIIMDALRGAREHSVSYYDAQIWVRASESDPRYFQ